MLRKLKPLPETFETIKLSDSPTNKGSIISYNSVRNVIDTIYYDEVVVYVWLDF